MKVLVLGAGGQVGAETARVVWPGGWEVIRLGRGALDITNVAALATADATLRPDLVVNLAAYTAVDRAETERDRAFAVNAAAPGAIAAVCARRNIPLLHVSTDYVFDGSKPTPYVEEDPVGPIGAYGASKEAGERAIRAVLERHIILRTAWVYGATGGNFVKTMLRLGAERPALKVVGDQHGSPTWAFDIAGALVTLSSAITDGSAAWGTYHFTGTGYTTWADFADELFELSAPVTGRRPSVERITTAEYPTPARRPANSRLDCSKLARVFGIAAPPWRQSLKQMLEDTLAPPSVAAKGVT